MVKLKILFTAGLAMFIVSISMMGCKKEEVERPSTGLQVPPVPPDEVEGEDYFLPNIDLSNWKVTLPVGNPTSVKPPEIESYATNDLLKDFMYNDSVNGALVFYAYPGATTTNTSYSRCELREQMVAGSDGTNWTFAEGGVMEGRLSMHEISRDAGGDFHSAIVMQIHGRLTDAQRDLIGASDNNAPPMLKIYWRDGKIRVKTKELIDLNTSETDILRKESWGDDAGFYFSETVGFDEFSLKVEVSEGKMTVTLNDAESKTYESIHMEKWGVFENYFKAGNYLQTVDNGAWARVKYYDLQVTH